MIKITAVGEVGDLTLIVHMGLADHEMPYLTNPEFHQNLIHSICDILAESEQTPQNLKDLILDEEIPKSLHAVFGGHHVNLLMHADPNFEIITWPESPKNLDN